MSDYFSDVDLMSSMHLTMAIKTFREYPSVRRILLAQMTHFLNGPNETTPRQEGHRTWLTANTDDDYFW